MVYVAGIVVVVAGEKNVDNYNIVRKILCYRYIQGTVKNQSRDGELILRASEDFTGNVTPDLSLNESVEQSVSICWQID